MIDQLGTSLILVIPAGVGSQRMVYHEHEHEMLPLSAFPDLLRLSTAQGLCCQAGQVHVPLLFVMWRWALENLSVLPVTCWVVVGPQPMLSVYGNWWNRRGCFQFKWLELHLPTSLVGCLGFKCLGTRIWPCFKLNRSQLCDEVIPSEAVPSFQLW